MLKELNESIRKVLVDEGKLTATDYEISFDLPNRDWAKEKVGKLTLNCYLFDVHEKRLFREEGWNLEERGSKDARRRRPPVFFEMTYLITAWSPATIDAVDDEHTLLWRALETLLRFPILPKHCLDDALKEPRYPWQVHTTIGQLEGVLKSPGEFWTALENHLKPSLSYTVMVGLDPEAAPAGPPVLSRRLRVGANGGPGAARGASTGDGTAADGGTGATGEGAAGVSPAGLRPLIPAVEGKDLVVAPGPDGRVALQGTIRGADGRVLPNAVIVVEGTNLRVVTDEQGQFRLPGLLPGRHTLVVVAGDLRERRTLVIRDPGYTLRVDLADPFAPPAELEDKGGSASNEPREST